MVPQADSSTSLFKDPTVGQNQTVVMESPQAMTPSSIQSPIQSLNNTSTNAHTGHSVVTQSSLAASGIETNGTSTNADVGHDSEPLHAEKPLPPVVNLNPSALNGSKFQEKSSPDIQPPAASSKVSNDSKGSGNSSDLASNPASPTKSSFMRKIRGEVKVLSGKLGKNEEKIEEGRRMMGKV
ncbi:hypothetical protein C8J56DRAFT_471590 [Mycena floridula]|nr:hypothetical protein C8J56DRAFT_471590 [Mycena floridula]